MVLFIILARAVRFLAEPAKCAAELPVYQAFVAKDSEFPEMADFLTATAAVLASLETIFPRQCAILERKCAADDA